MKFIVMMTGENIFGRCLIQKLLAQKQVPLAVIIETGSQRATAMLNYLRNDVFNPPALVKILSGHGVSIVEVDNLNGDNAQEALIEFGPDIVVLGGTSRIIKPEIIRLARLGVLNGHPGLLPGYRGRDIVGWAIYNGDPVGATCHFIDEGVDTGPILLRRVVSLSAGESLLEVRLRVMQVAANLIVESVQGLQGGVLNPEPQDLTVGKTYGPMPPEVLEAIEYRLKNFSPTAP